MLDKVIDRFKKEYRMKTVNPGQYGKLVIQGVNFTLECYDADGLGRVSVMHVKGLLGLIKREILVISPLECEMPVVTFERYKAIGRETFIWKQNDFINPVECVKVEGKKKELAEYDASVDGRIQEYIDKAKAAKPCNELERREPIFEYVDEIIDSAGLSAEYFLANYGIEHTIKVYHNFMFGTK